MNLRFVKREGGIRIIWKNFMYADVSEEKFFQIVRKYGNFYIKDSKIAVDIPQSYENLFLQDIYYLCEDKFKSLICQRKTYYIYDLPLTGYNAFGIIDRGTNLLQVRGSTSCNLNCIYCSVDEGPFSKSRVVDYVVSKDLLVDEFRRVAKMKKYPVEAHLDGQGEPLLYPDIVSLILEIRDVKNVRIISMQSNGLLLNDRFIEELAEAGLDRINISINSFDTKKAAFLAGVEEYNIERMLEIIDYLLQSGIRVLLAPVIVPGVNDKDIPNFIEFAKKKLLPSQWPVLGIQKYVPHYFGRKVNVKAQSFYEFYRILRSYEKKYNFKPLVLNPAHFNIVKDVSPKKKFKKGEKITVRVVLPGRLKDERIGLARNSLIQIINCKAEIGDKIKVVIRSTTHGVYVAEPV